MEKKIPLEIKEKNLLEFLQMLDRGQIMWTTMSLRGTKKDKENEVIGDIRNSLTLSDNCTKNNFPKWPVLSNKLWLEGIIDYLKRK